MTGVQCVTTYGVKKFGFYLLGTVSDVDVDLITLRIDKQIELGI